MTGEKPYQDEELLRALYWGQGWSLSKMAEKLDCGHDTIKRWMERNDIPRRDRRDASAMWSRENRRVEYASHHYNDSANKSGYEAWRDSISGEHVKVHQLLAIADGADPHEVFAEDKVVHHKSGYGLDNRPGNVEVMDHGGHTSHHHSMGIPKCKHRVLQSATIMEEERA